MTATDVRPKECLKCAPKAGQKPPQNDPLWVKALGLVALAIAGVATSYLASLGGSCQ